MAQGSFLIRQRQIGIQQVEVDPGATGILQSLVCLLHAVTIGRFSPPAKPVLARIFHAPMPTTYRLSARPAAKGTQKIRAMQNRLPISGEKDAW